MDNESATDKLMRHIQTTYKSRYNIHRRLLSVDRWQKITMTVMSIYIIAISIIIINKDIFGEYKSSIVNIYLIILSIISLALSLTMGQSDNKIKALQFYKCARKLQRLYNHVLMEREKDKNFKISNEEDKYNDILDKYKINHERIDYEYFIYEKWKENDVDYFNLVVFRVKYFVITSLLYIVLMIAPITLTLVFIS